MTMASLLAILVFLLATIGTVRGESTFSASLDGFPDCATKCLANALEDGLCAPTNQTCICTNEEFESTVTACVGASCTIPEALTTRNTSLTNCGAPVRDRSGELVTLSNAMAVVSALFVILRFVYKLFVIQLDLGLDDWLVLAAMVAAAPSAVINVYGLTANGLGKDIWTLDPKHITKAIQYFYMMAWMYFLETTLVKLSIISFYIRIFPSRNVQRVLWGTFIFTSLWGVSFVFAAVFQCRPIRYFWTKWDGMHQGSCVDANAIAWSNAAMNIALDLWILAIPLWKLRTLQLHWKKKIGVGLMFCVGAFVTVVSVLRLQSLVHFAATSNSTWEFYDVSVWSTVEICVGIICSCLPTVRLLLVKLFPILAGSTHGRKSYYYRYGQGAQSNNKSTDRRGHVAQVVTTERSNSEHDVEGMESHRGIIYQKSYNVQYTDNDEASLVRMDDLDTSSKRR